MDVHEFHKDFLEEVKANVGKAPYAAMINESIECLKYFIEERGIGADYCNVDGTPLLADAAGYGKEKSVEFLLKCGATIDYAPLNKDGSRKYSAMERAINEKRENIIQMLKSARGSKSIDPPIDVNFRGSAGSTSSSPSYVMSIKNTSSRIIHIYIFRNGEKIKADTIDAGRTEEYGWLELDRSFVQGDTGYIEASEYSRKWYWFDCYIGAFVQNDSWCMGSEA